MSADKELVKKMLESRDKKANPEVKVRQSMDNCVRFAIKDLEIAEKPVTEAAVLSRAKELFAIHG